MHVDEPAVEEPAAEMPAAGEPAAGAAEVVPAFPETPSLRDTLFGFLSFQKDPFPGCFGWEVGEDQVFFLYLGPMVMGLGCWVSVHWGWVITSVNYGLNPGFDDRAIIPIEVGGGPPDPPPYYLLEGP